MKNILVTYAVREEYIPLQIDGWNSSYIRTSVGKALSAMHVTRAILSGKPDLVLNIGTAGTIKHAVGEIFICTKFIDRDYQATKLPGLTYEIEGTGLAEKADFLRQLLANYHKTAVCSTGDTFITETGSLTEDVVDMEAYAQALVCKEFGIPFLSVKYVTDIIGQNSVEAWEDKLADARTALTEWFEEQKKYL
ncbi:MAG: nucleosidase [Candidatus Azobacteroides sp.]|nr:nucleosidase [Candidatus Azobacteroides sp.]